MSKVTELNETLTELDQKYFEAKKALEASRLEAVLTDAAQAVVDVEKPGQTVTDVLINTDPTYSLRQLFETLNDRIQNLTAENVQLKAELDAATAELNQSGR